jgi:HD-GYP domain-containing protein (c-di-GMP phosphodiesterase class II)
MNFAAILSQFRFAVTAGATAFALATLLTSQAPPLDMGLLLCLLLAVLSERWLLVLPRYGPFTLSESMIFAVMLRYGPVATLFATILAGLSRFQRESRQGASTRPEFIFYSLSQSWLSFGCAAWMWSKFRGLGPILTDQAPLDLFLMLLLAVGVFGVQAYVVAVHQWLEQQCLGDWSTRINWPRLRLVTQALLPLGVLFAACLQERPGAVLLLLGPLWVTYSSIRNYTATLQEAQQVVGSLAEAVERREPHTVGHSSRVGQLATDMGRYLRMSEVDVRTMASAARLHELGKISLGDHILCKSGSLQASEWERVRRYPEVGAEVASHLSLSRREAEIIRYHQEWYDGSGYPHGLLGEQIPLGSRVLSVAKAFDAMISRRSYRSALSWHQALRELRARAGTQFDPRVVAALEAVLGPVALRSRAA